MNKYRKSLNTNSLFKHKSNYCQSLRSNLSTRGKARSRSRDPSSLRASVNGLLAGSASRTGQQTAAQSAVTNNRGVIKV